VQDELWCGHEKPTADFSFVFMFCSWITIPGVGRRCELTPIMGRKERNHKEKHRNCVTVLEATKEIDVIIVRQKTRYEK
jgi:hypothetical protein